MNRGTETNQFNEQVSQPENNWYIVLYDRVISSILDINFGYWLGWLLTPIVLAFLLPLVLLVLIYISAFIAFA